MYRLQAPLRRGLLFAPARWRPDGRTVLLTFVCEGQEATVLQLPAKPATKEEADAQTRALYVG
jgi:hypothetical protein